MRKKLGKHRLHPKLLQLYSLLFYARETPMTLKRIMLHEILNTDHTSELKLTERTVQH